MVWIINQQGSFVSEDRPGFIKGDAMLALVLACLGSIPCEADLTHGVNIL